MSSVWGPRVLYSATPRQPGSACSGCFPAEKRKAEAARIKEKYPDRIPVRAHCAFSTLFWRGTRLFATGPLKLLLVRSARRS